MRAPAAAVEAAVGGLQLRHRHALRLQPRRPGAVGAEPRPARAAEREHHRIGRGLDLARGRFEAQYAGRHRGIADPAMPHVELHAGLAQPVQPGTQQRRGLHVGGKHAARAADEGLDAQARGPIAQLRGTEGREHRLEFGAAFAEAAHEGLEGLGVREVEPAAAREQELAPHRRHGVVEVHVRTGRGEDFRSHQAGGAAADHGDGGRRSHSRFTSSPCPVRNAARTVAPGWACCTAAR